MYRSSGIAHFNIMYCQAMYNEVIPERTFRPVKVRTSLFFAQIYMFSVTVPLRVCCQASRLFVLHFIDNSYLYYENGRGAYLVVLTASCYLQVLHSKLKIISPSSLLRFDSHTGCQIEDTQQDWFRQALKVGEAIYGSNVYILNHQNKHTPTLIWSRPYLDSSAPNIRTHD